MTIAIAPIRNEQSEAASEQFENRPPKPNITFVWEYITASIAAAYLQLNVQNQRRRKPTWIAFLVECLINGTFKPTHQGIAFDRHGNLIDGQNRLYAIVQSGRGAWIAVARGVDPEAIAAIDVGSKRTDADHAKILTGLNTSHTEVAVAKAMNAGIVGSNSAEVLLRQYELFDFIRTHWEAIQFSAMPGKRRGLSCAVVRGGIAKAFYHADRDRLEQLKNVIWTGEPSGPRDRAAIRLRELLMRTHYNGATLRAQAMAKVLGAIVAFVEERPIDKLYGVSTDPFPLPPGK